MRTVAMTLCPQIEEVCDMLSFTAIKVLIFACQFQYARELDMNSTA
jgi:hypothetical protein